MAPVRHSHTDKRTQRTPAAAECASAALTRPDATPRLRKAGSVQSRLTSAPADGCRQHQAAHGGVAAQGDEHDVVGERAARVEDFCSVAVGQTVHVDDRLALLGLRPQVVRRQQLGQPFHRRDLVRPAGDDHPALIRHDASITGC